MDPDLRGLGETEFSVFEASCSQAATPGHGNSFAAGTGEDSLKARLRIPPPTSFCTETFPLSQSATPFPLRSFEAVYDGSIKLFQEQPSRFFENEIAELEPPQIAEKNARKRLAEESASVDSASINQQVLSHKRLCPQDSSQLYSGNLIQDTIDDTINDTSNEDLPSSPANENNIAPLVSEPVDSDWVLPSPSNSVASYQASREFNLDIESSLSSLTAIEFMPRMIQLFETYPSQVQNYFLYQLLRRVPRPSLQYMSSLVVPHLKRNFIAKLPYEIAHRILEFMDAPTLCAASQVDRTWKHLIDSNDTLWERRLRLDSLSPDPVSFNTSTISRWKLGSPQERLSYEEVDGLGPYVSNATESKKAVYARRHKTNRNWASDQGRWIKFQAPNVQVITCLQFDDEKIVMGSESTIIGVYHLRTGDLYKHLEGHDGGVWTLQFVANTLATGSTDRTVRIWDIKKGVCTHIFTGHTSTVRCLQIVLPIEVIHKDSYGQRSTFEPAHPLVVTGSRDSTLRVWKLPSPSSDEPFVPACNTSPPNPFFQYLFQGHDGSVRTLSAQGKYLASGSYDNSVRVWDLEKGGIVWHFTGHTNKVYNVVMDRTRLRCMSGSMDYAIRVWDIAKGTCLATLSAHSSLVGLLQLSSDFLVSAAADATIRVWDPDTLECRHLMKGHQGAIMALHHDTNRVISGSDGGVKLWDIHTGRHIRDLISGVNGVWQIKANEDVCVAAVNRGDTTCIEIVDFSHRPPRISM